MIVTTKEGRRRFGYGFQEHYAKLSDDELLSIAGDRQDLRDEAGLAIDAEMARRGLTYQQAHAKKREGVRLEIKEARAHSPKPEGSKYFVANLNLRWYLIGLAAFVSALVVSLALHHHRLLDEWTEPIAVVCIAALIACSTVQPWVRRTLSFWLSLGVSCIPQFVVSHWLTVYHPRTGAKGTWFLSALAGYLVGGALFLLLQKLKPGQVNKAAQ